MFAIASLLITITMSLLVTRVATMALMLTGMSREAARFQARSAFTGVGFTTTESEDVASHPVRRRIVMMLMLFGNMGIATVVATVILSFVRTAESEDWWWYLLSLGFGLLGLWYISNSRIIERHLNRVIAKVLSRWGQLQTRDYVAILQLRNGYAVSELKVEPNNWIAGRTLIDLKLTREGLLVLGIQRKEGTYFGTPTGDTEIQAGDVLVLYGPIGRIDELDRRGRGRQGDAAHEEAAMEHAEDLHEQEEQDEEVLRERKEKAERDDD